MRKRPRRHVAACPSGAAFDLLGAVLAAAAGRGRIRAAASKALYTRTILAAGVGTISPSGAAYSDASRRSAAEST